MSPGNAEYKQRAVQLLERLESIRQTGQGSIPMHQLLALVDTAANPQLTRKLTARGDLELEIGPEGRGRFRNAGPELTLSMGPITLHIPCEVRGDVTCNASAVLSFAQRHTVTVRALLLHTWLRCLEVSADHIAVRFGNHCLDRVHRF